MNFISSDMDNLQQGVIVEGISSDYVWYESKRLTDKMSSWGFEFQKITNVMETRHKEHLKMIADLLAERAELKRELRKFKTEVKE